jgi:hypothetical protein
VSREAEAAGSVHQSLVEFVGAALSLTKADFEYTNVIFKVGVDPVEVEILSTSPRLEFDAVWTRRAEILCGEIPVPVITYLNLSAAMATHGESQFNPDNKVTPELMELIQKLNEGRTANFS